MLLRGAPSGATRVAHAHMLICCAHYADAACLCVDAAAEIFRRRRVERAAIALL